MSVITLEPIFKACFPTAFAPEYSKRFNKTKESPEERPYAVTPLNPKTCPVNRTQLTATTALINIVSCISIHCNSYTEFY